MAMQDTWVIVADASRARMFKTRRHNGPLLEFKTLLNSAGRSAEAELVSDTKGRTYNSMGQGRHAKEPRTDAKTQKVVEFARTLASELEHCRVRGKFKQLILVAAPAYLGELRKQLGAETTKLVSLEIAKDFSQFDPTAIREQLPETLPMAG